MDIEKFYKNIIDMLPDPIFAIDKEGKVILWNSAMEKLTKVKKEEVLGKGNEFYSKVFYGYKRSTLIDLVLNPNEDEERNHYTNFIRYQDGTVEGETYSPILDYYDWGKAVPIINDNGEIEAVISISRNISANIKFRKQQDVLLKRYKTLFVNSPDAIACFNKNHVVFDVNESFLRIFGYTREECIGRDLDDLVVPEPMKEQAQKATDELFEKSFTEFESIRYTKSGEPIAVNIRGILIKVEDEIIGGYGIYTDITEKCKYKEELESTNVELEAAVEQLMSNEEELRVQYDEIQQYSEINEVLRQKYEIAIEATDSFIWEIDTKSGKISFSKNFVGLVGADKIQKENIYEIIDEVVHDEDKNILINEINKYNKGLGGEINTQIRIIDKNKNIHWYLVRGKGIRNREGIISALHGVLIEITEMKKQEQYVNFFAYHDPLTGLYNRRKFNEIMEKELAGRKKGALFLLDVDDFKNINDILGHVYGDELLKQIANLLKEISDDKIIAFRFGGDEFLIVVKEEEKEYIVQYAEKVIKTFKDNIIVDYMENNVTVSMGIVKYPDDAHKIDELMIKADIAMYSVKKSGKNSYLFFNEYMKKDFNEKIKIESMLRKALKNEFFLLLYQPIIETETGRISSFEALLRIKDWNISPDIFIPIAEETGLILPIGKWVINEAVKQISEWIKKGYKPIPISINLSPKQFYDSNLIEYIEKALKFYNVDPSLMEIEITENIFADKKNIATNILNKLKNLGVSISLDDFGTGYSSLNYLTFMPIDKIKLDKSLKDKFIELENIKIMDNLIAFAHDLNLKVVTEGVEKIEEYKKMKRAGSDYLQGYLFSKPVDKEEVEKIFNNKYNSLLNKKE